jgi:hypothetical protein
LPTFAGGALDQFEALEEDPGALQLVVAGAHFGVFLAGEKSDTGEEVH